MSTANTASPAPKLHGLVLAGGDSVRMGVDKGLLDYHGQPQFAYLSALLEPHCERVLVSINPDQADVGAYASFATVVDAFARQGPATGLLSAAQRHPEVAWLAVAVDLVSLDAQTVAALVAGRRATASASAFRQADGTLEPLCAIWEPAALAALRRRVSAGDASPRRCLEEAADVEIVACPRPEVLRSVNSVEERARILGAR